MRYVALLSICPLLATACVADDSDEIFELDETTAKADGISWYKVYTCNGGQAVLDVQANERRNLQFVIRDEGIVDYLADESLLPREDIVNSAGEIILHARLDHGVFSKSDFSAMHPRTLDAYDRSLLVSPHVFRDGSGIKIELERQQADGFSGICDGGNTECTPTHYRWVGSPNWYFDDCH